MGHPRRDDPPDGLWRLDRRARAGRHLDGHVAVRAAIIGAALVSGLAACFALDALRYNARTDNVSFVIEMKGTRVEDALRALLIAAVLGTGKALEVAFSQLA